MKTISEFQLSNEYRFFSIVPLVGDLTVKAFTSIGYETYNYCDIYCGESSSLVCFKQPPAGSPTIHNFLVSNGEDNFIIQEICYENCRDILSGEQLYPYSMYLYLNSVNVNGNIADTAGISDVDHYHKDKIFNRCDVESWGPLSFYDVQSGYDIAQIRVVLSLSGTAHIVRFDINSSEIKNTQSRAGNAAARSIRGIFKTIHEWSIVSEEPFSNIELPAVKAVPFLTGIGMPNDVLNDLISESPEMRVAQYLRNATIPYSEFVENYSVPESFSTWMSSVVRYKTISAAVKNSIYSSGITIDNVLLQSEKQEIEQLLFSLAIAAGVLPDSITLENVSTIANSIVNATGAISIADFVSLFRNYDAYQ